jgi:hypothetical protein
MNGINSAGRKISLLNDNLTRGSPQFSQSGFFHTQHHEPQQRAPKDMNLAFAMVIQASASASDRPKRNQYPCPLAKQENCHDFFTTSGHAARHSKKHTGHKDAICPECNKPFTRKDNMEQHRRTHKGGRGNAKAASDRGTKKASARAQRPKISPSQTSTPVLSPTALDPISPSGSFMVQSTHSAFMQPAHGYNYPAPPSNDHAGLEVLATAASDTRRFS